MSYFVAELGLVTVGPMTATSTLKYIQHSKAPLGNLLITEPDGKSVSLQSLCERAHAEETNALVPTR